MGHEDIRTTQIYADYSPDAHEVDLVNAAFAPTDTNTDTSLRPTQTNSDPRDPVNPGDIR